MTSIRRNPLQSAVGALLAVGLVISALVASSGTSRFKNAAACGSGYGYGYDPTQQGYGYAPGCPGPSGRFAEGKVFTVERGQTVKLTGTGGAANAPGTIELDRGNSTAAAASGPHAASTPEPQVLGTFVTDQNGAFTTTITIPAGLSFGRHTISAIVNGQVVAFAYVIVVPDLKGDGYRMIAGDGGSFNYGNNKFMGSVPEQLHGALPNKPVVGGDNTPSNQGYWMAAPTVACSPSATPSRPSSARCPTPST